MRQYVFSPVDESWQVIYQTNGIAENQRLFINEIKSIKNGVISTGVLPEGQIYGLWDEYVELMAVEFKDKAVAVGLNLRTFAEGEEITYGDPPVVLPPDAPPGSSEAEFIWFATKGHNTHLMINVCNRTVDVGVAFGTDVTDLIGVWEASAGAKIYIGEVEQVSNTTENDFTSPVAYTVVSENTLVSHNYVVTVTADAE